MKSAKEIICAEQGNIVAPDYVDAIVNAANESLLGGGGVDGAIHYAAGHELLKECKTLNGCKMGEAKITGAYNLNARHIIHAVGPRWHGGNHGEAELLASCYKSVLELATEYDIHTLRLPSLSTGAFGYPVAEAAKVAVKTVADYLQETTYDFTEIKWMCFDKQTLIAYTRAISDYFKK